MERERREREHRDKVNAWLRQKAEKAERDAKLRETEEKNRLERILQDMKELGGETREATAGTIYGTAYRPDCTYDTLVPDVAVWRVGDNRSRCTYPLCDCMCCTPLAVAVAYCWGSCRALMKDISSTL